MCRLMGSCGSFPLRVDRYTSRCGNTYVGKYPCNVIFAGHKVDLKEMRRAVERAKTDKAGTCCLLFNAPVIVTSSNVTVLVHLVALYSFLRCITICRAQSWTSECRPWSSPTRRALNDCILKIHESRTTCILDWRVSKSSSRASLYAGLG